MRMAGIRDHIINDPEFKITIRSYAKGQFRTWGRLVFGADHALCHEVPTQGDFDKFFHFLYLEEQYNIKRKASEDIVRAELMVQTAVAWQEYVSYLDKSKDAVAQIRYLQENKEHWAAATALNDDIDLQTLSNFDIYIQGARLERDYLKTENRVRLADLVESFWRLSAFAKPEPVVFMPALTSSP